MSLAEENRKEIVLYRLERASSTLQQAEVNLGLHFYETAANRLYYAVSALLIANQILTHSHDGVISQFGLHYVKPGKVNRDMGKLLRQLYSLRKTGDYSDMFYLAEEDVLPLIEPTRKLVEEVSLMAKKSIL